MRIVAFADRQGGADNVADAINLPDEIAGADHCIPRIDRDARGRACQWSDVCGSQALLSIFQGASIRTKAILPGATLPGKIVSYDLHNFESAHLRIRPVRAATAFFLRSAPSTHNSACSPDSQGIQKTPFRHARRLMVYGKYSVQPTHLTRTCVDNSAHPKGPISDVPLQKQKPQPIKAEFWGSHP